MLPSYGPARAIRLGAIARPTSSGGHRQTPELQLFPLCSGHDVRSLTAGHFHDVEHCIFTTHPGTAQQHLDGAVTDDHAIAGFGRAPESIATRSDPRNADCLPSSATEPSRDRTLTRRPGGGVLVTRHAALFGGGVLVFDVAGIRPLVRSPATRLSQRCFRFGRACDAVCG